MGSAANLKAHTTSHTYEPLFQQVKTVTDPLGHTTTFDEASAACSLG